MRTTRNIATIILAAPIAISAPGCVESDPADTNQVEAPHNDTSAPGAGAPGGDLAAGGNAAAVPGFPLEITVTNDEDVQVTWSIPGGAATYLYRAPTPELLRELPAAGSIDPSIVVTAIPGYFNSTFEDVGAASRSVATPNYYYRVRAGTQWSTIVMKTTTALAPGFNKFGLCMLDGPTRASDFVDLLGAAVQNVWGWDAATQTYLQYSPSDGPGSAQDFSLGFGQTVSVQANGTTPAYQSLVGVVPTDEAYALPEQPGYNWLTLPPFYAGSASAAYWVDEVGYNGMGRWDNVTQSAQWYWGSEFGAPDFELSACEHYYSYLPDTICDSNADCGAGFCFFAPGTSCGEQGAGVCTPFPPECEAGGDPVCGCDDQTYDNACQAAQAGVGIGQPNACEGCGNGVIEPGEECDLTDLGGQTCADFEGDVPSSGSASCTAECTLSSANCCLGTGAPCTPGGAPCCSFPGFPGVCSFTGGGTSCTF